MYKRQGYGGYINRKLGESNFSLTVMQDGEVRGFAITGEDGSGYLRLPYMFLAPDVRRQGHGRRLLSSVIVNAYETHKLGVSLWVAQSNPARSLYDRQGFEVVNTAQAWYGPAWVMQRSVDQPSMGMVSAIEQLVRKEVASRDDIQVDPAESPMLGKGCTDATALYGS